MTHSGVGLAARVAALRALRGMPWRESDRLTWLVRAYFKGSRKRLRRVLAAFGARNDDAAALADNRNFMENESAVGAVDVACTGSAVMDAVQGVCHDVLSEARDRIELAVLDRAELFEAPKQNIEAAMAHLSQRLWVELGPTIAVEFNLFCLRAGLPVSNTGAVDAFLAQVGHGKYRQNLFGKYPELRRSIVTIARNVTDAFTELVARLSTDHSALAALQVANDEKIGSIELGAGDSHKGGRGVCFICFRSRVIVYKPRPLSPERTFAAFMGWLAAKDASLAARCVAVLDRGDYGYCEFVGRSTLQSVDAATFYRRIGVLLVAAHVLGLADLHFENVIAVGSDPVLVDIESILSKPLKANGFADSYVKAFSDLLFHSLLLPLKVSGSEGVADASAVGSAGTPAALGQPRVFDAGAAGFVARQTEGAGDNRLGVRGEAHAPYAHLDSVLAGYEAAADVVLRCRDELRPGGFLPAGGVWCRWIGRPTQVYTEALSRMRHPTVQSHALERDCVAAGVWGEGDQRGVAPLMLPSEVRDLRDGDVPYFSTDAASCDLVDAAGKVISDVFACSGNAAMQQRLDQLITVRTAHRRSIRAAFESTRPEPTAPSLWAGGERSKAAFAQREALASAVLIALELSTPHMADGMPFWTGLHEVVPRTVGATVLLPTVYDGSLGIGLFLAAVARVAPSKRLSTLVAGVHRMSRSVLDSDLEHGSGSAFSGFGGALYTNLVTAPLVGVEPVRYSARLDRAFAKWAAQEANCDYVGGLAGAMVVLQRYAAATGDERATRRVLALRESILSRAEWAGDRCFWRSPMFELPLGGFAHGTAGIAFALASSCGVHKDARVAATIEGALRHDESYYRSDLGTWIDGRNGAASNYWCHGAAGIGLACQTIYDVTRMPLAKEMTVRAVRAVLQQGPLDDDCLCHGTLGNAELLMAVGESEAARLFTAAAQARFDVERQWSCLGAGVERVPGLFCGLSGIGYQMLRYAAPTKVPNVLMLQL